MRKTGLFTVVAFLFSISVNGFAAKTVSPTTTLSAETGNNTSTANSFQAQSNGNARAGNVSKVNTRSLLYAGSTTGIYAHYMPWFGTSWHVNVGYDTRDGDQAARTVNDMISRGIQGIIVDWYGRNAAHEEQSTQAIFNEAKKHSGFKFALMEDAGALKGSNKTGDLIADLIYAHQKYQQSGNYMKINGRPVVFFFGVETLPIDWNAVRSQVPGNPLFMFQNSGMFGTSYSDGAFSWIGAFGNVNDWGQSYLANFYETGKKSSKRTVGSVKKGFNDKLSAWSMDRVINQNCGQTWLSTFAEIGRHYSSTKQLESLQIVTWNDYEEGSPIEMGIDNCVAVKASVSGSVLSWSISGGGQENTIHHYTVFISTDGQNLMPVTDVPSGTHHADLAQFGFASGAYNVYVKAVGQPSIRNKMSNVAGYTSHGGSGAGAPAGADLALAAGSVTVSRGSTGTMSVTVTPSGNFSSPVTLGCSNLPAGVTCSFDQTVITPGPAKVSTKLTMKANRGSTTASLFGSHGTFALWFPGLGFGMVLVGDRKRSKKFWAVTALVAVIVLMMMATGCGGGGGASGFSSSGSVNADLPSAPGTYTFQVTASTGSFVRSTSATVVVK